MVVRRWPYGGKTVVRGCSHAGLASFHSASIANNQPCYRYQACRGSVNSSTKSGPRRRRESAAGPVRRCVGPGGPTWPRMPPPSEGSAVKASRRSGQTSPHHHDAGQADCGRETAVRGSSTSVRAAPDDDRVFFQAPDADRLPEGVAAVRIDCSPGEASEPAPPVPLTGSGALSGEAGEPSGDSGKGESAATGGAARSSARWQRTLDALNECIAAGWMTGAQVSARLPGAPPLDLWVGEVRPGLPQSRLAMMNWMSTSKAVTVVAIAQLVELGRLRVTDRVAQHLPSFGVYGAARHPGRRPRRRTARTARPVACRSTTLPQRSVRPHRCSAAPSVGRARRPGLRQPRRHMGRPTRATAGRLLRPQARSTSKSTTC